VLPPADPKEPTPNLLEPVDESARNKSLAQLLAENPQQKGGLAQLAAAEQQALSRSTEPPTE
jgi:chromatin segregation and condensation protein Rec8/ScpA/Scc1 (kleisin family)